MALSCAIGVRDRRLHKTKLNKKAVTSTPQPETTGRSDLTVTRRTTRRYESSVNWNKGGGAVEHGHSCALLSLDLYVKLKFDLLGEFTPRTPKVSRFIIAYVIARSVLCDEAIPCFEEIASLRSQRHG